MNFTSKEEYGLLAAVHLAAGRGAGPIQAHEIARAEGIPEQFLEQVLALLRRAGIVRSIRGASGGYQLAHPAQSIMAGDVIRALSGDIVPIPCREGSPESCQRLDGCVVVRLWERVRSAVLQVLDNTTIQDMADERARLREQGCFMMNI